MSGFPVTQSIVTTVFTRQGEKLKPAFTLSLSAKLSKSVRVRVNYCIAKRVTKNPSSSFYQHAYACWQHTG